MGSLAMAKSEQSGVRPRRGRSADLRSDEDLVLAIAGSRDRDAFLELFNRHQQAAFNLACHVAGNRTLGEEAVQEAMLRLWTSAKTFKPEGNARAWLLRIVAREALRSLKGQRRHARRADVDLDGQPSGSDEARGAGRDAVDRELLAALHGQLEQLEPAQRSLLALYFTGGLTQREIAEALSTTQQTVSNKLNETLATLRKNLAQAGFAAAAPLLGAGEIGAALDSAHEAPAGLADELAAKLGQAADVSQRVAAAKGASALLWAAGVLAVAAAGGGAWWLSQPAPEVKEAQDKADSASGGGTEARRPSAVSDAAPRSATWDFTGEPPEGLRILTGGWERKTEGGRSYMDVPNTVFLILPFETRAVPVRIDVEVSAIKLQDNLSFGAYWIKDLPDRYIHLAREVYKQRVVVTTAGFKEIHFIDGRYIMNVVGGQVGYCSRYENEYPGDHLVISVGNSKLYRITLREITKDEIPEACRDPEALIPTLTKEHRAYPEQILMKEP